MTANSDAYLVGRMVAERQIEDETLSSVAGQREHEIVKDQVDARTGGDPDALREYEDGFQFAVLNYRDSRYRFLDDIGIGYARRFLRGERHPEESLGKLLLEQPTIDRVHQIHEWLPDSTLDEFINASINALTLIVEMETGNQLFPNSAIVMIDIKGQIREPSGS